MTLLHGLSQVSVSSWQLSLQRLISKALFSFSGLFIHVALLWGKAELAAACLTWS